MTASHRRFASCSPQRRDRGSSVIIAARNPAINIPRPLQSHLDCCQQSAAANQEQRREFRCAPHTAVAGCATMGQAGAIKIQKAIVDAMCHGDCRKIMHFAAVLT